MNKATRAKSPTGRLSENQYDLLLYVLSGAMVEEKPISWSPTRFLGRTPSKSEAVILSKRLSGLIERGLIQRSNDLLEITDFGRQVLSAYVGTAQDDDKAAYTSCLLRLERAWKWIGSVNETSELLGSKVLFGNYTYDVPAESMSTTRAVLEGVREKLDGEIDELLDYIRASAEAMQRRRGQPEN